MHRLALTAVALIALATLSTSFVHADSSSPRVPAMYTTWDDYYVYVGFQVNDSNVISLNTTPTSQPQEDDDVEVFFETDDARADHRTPHTYQMAVSAGNGAYFSVGNDSQVPQAEVVYTYKYAATTDGTLNDPSDVDTGYTVELAIPWQELGLDGPPKAGTIWGFNAISRDRNSMTVPSDRFYSLSEAVQSGADVQNPSKWTKIAFDSGGTVAGSSSTLVDCPYVTERYPFINGSIVSGEWPSISRVSFGFSPILSPAPTQEQEPNTTESPFGAPPSETQSAPPEAAPAAPVVAPPPAAPSAPAPLTSIALPNGGSIKIVPGGIPNPVGFEPSEPAGQALGPASGGNPLEMKGENGYGPAPAGVAFTGTLSLGQPSRPNLIMALYRLDYNGDPRLGSPVNVWDDHGKSLLVDQPMDGTGPWFSGLRTTWQRNQLTDLRRSGIDVALIEPAANDPSLLHEVDALVAALKELCADGQDYPLIGVDGVSADPQQIAAILDRIPDVFRAKWASTPGANQGALVYGAPSALQPLTDGVPVAVVSPGDAEVVTPGPLDNGVLPRKDGEAYATAVQKAYNDKVGSVVIDSWNDFSTGTDIAATRQYGWKYADATKLASIAYNGGHEWHAKYLSYSVPQVIRPKTLYTLSLRVENAGTLPWRTGENYSLCTRWYLNGRLYDDSAPRIPLSHDVFPGQSATINVGLVAMNGYGEDLDPGSYVLMFDMVQGQDKWFSLAADTPLQVPVTIVGATDPVPAAAAFLGTTTPPAIAAGVSVKTTVEVRNDGADAWGSGYKLVYKIIADNSDGPKMLAESTGALLDTHVVQSGEIGSLPATVTAATTDGTPLPAGEYRLHWLVLDPDGTAVAGASDEGLEVTPGGPDPSFVLSDIPRSAQAGKSFISKLAVRNVGVEPWKKGSLQIGYHWYYLDGVEAAWDSRNLTPLPDDIAPGAVDPEIAAKATAPSLPGRYVLVWDVKTATGAWASTHSTLPGDSLMSAIVTVTGKTNVVPVDLSRYTGAADTGFAADGSRLPLGMLPPDGAGEVDVNPLLFAKPGPPLYPSGYYASTTGDGWSSNHAVPFLYPDGPTAGDGIPCHGQRIDLPSGQYSAVHILAAATGDESVAADFSVGSGDRLDPVSLTISSWKTSPTQPAWSSPYYFSSDGDVMHTTVYLGDYTVPTSGERIDQITLPDAQKVKVLAITLVH